eukprot:TRINITY_DN5090_c2_g1_i1.p1 TRINITY_DN5090_c2_g1~~TRINITY_DN5090_c2_g1_i1.p1  ORF type:complete len:396 (-),score=151.64 TRINITY_DN5090_c2_g1_i1:60-1247(-)
MQTSEELRKSNQKKILILGGTNFMGRTLVHSLLEQNHLITILNRGNVYWNDADPFGDRVRKVVCDRDNTQLFKRFLTNLLDQNSVDYIVDFSAYEPSDIIPVVEVFGGGKIKHYIFISTDSIYMVCKTPESNRQWKEEDAIRPQNEDLRNKLAKGDSYGHKKMKCEEFLIQTFQQIQFPYTSLRLPDVIGPYDGTDRFWKYQLWLRVSRLVDSNGSFICDPVDVTLDAITKPLSFVISNDVITAIHALWRMDLEKIIGQSYNLSFIEQPNLKQFLDLMSHYLKIDTRYYNRFENQIKNSNVNNNDSNNSDTESDDDDDDATEYYPSVSCGPIDITKAINELQGWKPTPLANAIEITCKFFDDAWFNFENDRPVKRYSKQARQIIHNHFIQLKQSL